MSCSSSPDTGSAAAPDALPSCWGLQAPDDGGGNGMLLLPWELLWGVPRSRVGGPLLRLLLQLRWRVRVIGAKCVCATTGGRSIAQERLHRDDAPVERSE